MLTTGFALDENVRQHYHARVLRQTTHLAEYAEADRGVGAATGGQSTTSTTCALTISSGSEHNLYN